LLESLAPSDPHPPAVREQLAATAKALAFTWKISPDPDSQMQAEAHFRHSLGLYRELERDWPDRRQPIGLCLRYVAELEFQRGELAGAERLWREAIASEERYLLQNPTDLDSRSVVCWSCADLADAILLRSPDRLAEAELLLTQGRRHVEKMHEQAPRSTQARQAAAFLQLCSGRCACGLGRVDEGIALFRQAAKASQTLCVDFPSYAHHWDAVRYAFKEIGLSLTVADRLETRDEFSRDMEQWLLSVAAQFSSDKQVQSQIVRCRDGVVAESNGDASARSALPPPP
jgi:hypothetical protein